MDPKNWLKQNEEYFSVEMNGYRRIPVGTYLTTLPLIDRDGKIADLGCGNGMLLKFLMKSSGKDLTPFGVDINEKAIKQAQQEVLPEFKDHFVAASLSDENDFDFSTGPYNIIITNPAYGGRGIEGYVNRCVQNLTGDGRLIFRVHDDVLDGYGLKSLIEFPGVKKLEVRLSRGDGLEFGVYDKKT